MTILAKPVSLLNIRPGEGKLVLLMLAQYFFLGVAFVNVQAATYALFLGGFTAQDLPYVYMASAGAVTLIAYIYLRLSERLSFSKLLITNLSFLLLITLLFRFGLDLTEAKWLIFSLPILTEALVSLGNLEFWTLAGRIFNVRQGKRLFGLIGGGQWIASVITGFLTPTVVELVGTPNLLLVGAAGIAIALGLLIYTTRSFAPNLSPPAEDTPTRRETSSLKLLKSRYILLIFVIITFWWVSFFFIDNIFFDRAVVQFPDEDQLAGFIGLFFGVTGMVTVLSTTVVTGPVIGRYGVRLGVLVLPVTLIIGATLMATTGTIFGPVALLLWLATATKMFNFAFGFSIDRVARTILYQPLPAEARVRAQTAAEGIVYPLAVGVAGGLLLLLINLFGFGVVQLAYTLCFILAAWIIVATWIGRREYPTHLMQALLKRGLNGAGLHLDKSSETVLRQALQSPHPNVVIYALNMLEESGTGTGAGYLPDLLAHPAPEVRQESLRRIERLRLGEALEAVSQVVETEGDSTVQATALRTLATLCDAEALEQIYPYLEAPDPQVRRGAIVGLLQNAGLEVTVMAEAKLLQMAMSEAPGDRLVVAQVIGEVAARNLRQLLEQLLQDEDLPVRRAALTAAGQAKYPELWPLVVAGVGVPYVRKAATTALIAGGEAAIGAVQAALIQPDQDRQLLVRLARVCGRIGGSQTIDFLKENLDFPHHEVRTHLLRALSQGGYRATASERARILRQINTEIGQAAAILASLVDLAGPSPLSPAQPPPGQSDPSGPESQSDRAISMVTAVLDHELAQIRSRIFFLLSFIYDAQTILQARNTLEDIHASPEKQAYALEVLDLQLPRELKTKLFPILPRELNPGESLKQLGAAFPQVSADRSQRLQQIITGPDRQVNSWTRACALYATGRLKLNDEALVRDIISTLHTYPHDALVTEMGIWSLATLDGSVAPDRLSQLNDPVRARIAAVAAQLKVAGSQNVPLLSTVDKVMILKQAGIFTQTTDQDLVDLATLLAEVRFKAAETIIKKGAHGDCMYFIVAGEVRLHDGPQTIIHLPAGELFGEMALLDAAPRTVSVTATVDTHLLRLDQAPFYEFIEDHIELVRGIIHMLSRRLRSSVRDLTDLKRLLSEKESRES